MTDHVASQDQNLSIAVNFRCFLEAERTRGARGHARRFKALGDAFLAQVTFGEAEFGQPHVFLQNAERAGKGTAAAARAENGRAHDVPLFVLLHRVVRTGRYAHRLLAMAANRGNGVAVREGSVPERLHRLALPVAGRAVRLAAYADIEIDK